MLLGDSREHDFRALLRVLRERVVDATGLLEDGSALGVAGQVQGRVLDSPEFRPLAPPPDKTPANAPATAQRPRPRDKPLRPLLPRRRRGDQDHRGAGSDRRGHPRGQPGAGLDVTGGRPREHAGCRLRRRAGAKKPARKTAANKGPAPLPTAVAIRCRRCRRTTAPRWSCARRSIAATWSWRGRSSTRTDKKKWKPPVADRPTLTLYARTGDKEVALSRWPTTIGGWKTIEKKDGTMALKYKESVTGDALWPEVLATPSWHPAPGMPTRKLLVKRGDTFEPKTEIIGPGYRAAYGLVAIVHHQIMERNEKGEPQLMDLRIRTHGTPAYRSVKRGESNGCHRLHNYLALRLSAFLVKHREHVRDGLVPEDYVRNLEYKGQKVALESESKGYRFKLTPPVPVTVLDGDVKGDAKAVKRLVPLAAVP